jgi:hypothetical protein
LTIEENVGEVSNFADVVIMRKASEKWHLLFYPIILIVTFLVAGHPFFWDTVQLASKHGHFFYETDFQSLILPEEIDSGHPPLFGMYMALTWKLFGKTLMVSHLAMLPFLFGIVYSLQKIGEKIAGPRQAAWLVLICLLDPVLASQGILVSPDVLLVCCFLMAVWTIWKGKLQLLTLAILGLGLVSTRGMMVGAALYLFSVLIDAPINLRSFLQKLGPFLPGGIAAGAYLFYHWQQTGWIGYHPTSTWAPSFERVDIQGFAKNLVVLCWRFLDFGRVFIWIALGLLLLPKLGKLKMFQRKIDPSDLGIQLFLLSLLVFVFTVPTQLFYRGLLAHRYLLPCFLCLNFLLFHFLSQQTGLQFQKKKKWFLALVCAGLFSGNFWVYPPSISMGWDSTLAHTPWYGLLGQAMSFLKKNNIPLGTVGTVFPNIGKRDFYELDGDSTGFSEKDFEQNCFIFYSNIMNDFTDEELAELNANWPIVFKQNSGGVFAIIYKNPKIAVCGN